jgi:hypothetical protein
MNDNEARPWVDAAELQRRLTEHGVVVLAVTGSGSQDGWFTVFLHGLAGNDHQLRAFAFLAGLPGVVEVRVSEQTESILLVRQRREDPPCP